MWHDNPVCLRATRSMPASPLGTMAMPSPIRPPCWSTSRIALLVLALEGLVGCQRTLFSGPPAATTRCDAALQGHWVSVDEQGEPDGEISASLGSDCRLGVVEQRPDGPRVWPPVSVASAHVAGRDLVWLDAGAVNAAFDIRPGPLDRDGAVYVFAYAIRGERLDLQPPDHRRLARRVVDDDIDGAALVDGRDITVRVDGDAPALARVIGDRRSFQRTEPLRFRRAEDGKAGAGSP